jgi:hypothetical protein
LGDRAAGMLRMIEQYRVKAAGDAVRSILLGLAP